MSKILWIPEETDDYRKLLGVRLGMALAFLAVHATLCFRLSKTYAITKVEEYFFVLMALACIFLAIGFIIDTLVIKSNVFALPSILIVYEDKIFLQNPIEFGWKVIPRKDFKVKVISYKPAKNPNDLPRNTLKIILEKPCKGRTYYPLGYNLFKDRSGRINVTDAHLRKLIALLKPRRIMDLGGIRIAAGYSIVIANYSNDREIIELAERALEYDFTKKTSEITGEFRLLGYRTNLVEVLYAIDYSLVAITLFGSRSDVRLFLGMIVDESFVDYVHFLGPGFIKRWVPYVHRYNTPSNIAGLLGAFCLILMVIGILLSPNYWGYLFTVLLWYFLAYGLHWIVFGGAPFVSDVRDLYFRGCRIALFYWLFFVAFHASLPFIAWLLTGFFNVIFIIIYLFVSLVMSYAIYLDLLDDFRICYYKRLYNAWREFLRKYKKSAESI